MFCLFVFYFQTLSSAMDTANSNETIMPKNMEQCEEDSLTVIFDTPTKDMSTQTNSHTTYTKHAMTSTNSLRSYATKSV